MNEGLFYQLEGLLNNAHTSNKDLMNKLTDYIFYLWDLIRITINEYKGQQGIAVLIAKKYESKQSLQKKLVTSLTELNETIVKFDEKIRKIKDNVLSGKLQCNICGGLGYAESFEWIREDESVATQRIKNPCRRCEGKGFLSLTEHEKKLIVLQFLFIEEQLKFYKRIIENTNLEELQAEIK